MYKKLIFIFYKRQNKDNVYKTAQKTINKAFLAVEVFRSSRVSGKTV